VLENTTHSGLEGFESRYAKPYNAEDFKQGAMFEKAADTHAADGTLLKIPLC
jgi:hypothetical protein